VKILVHRSAFNAPHLPRQILARGADAGIAIKRFVLRLIYATDNPLILLRSSSVRAAQLTRHSPYYAALAEGVLEEPRDLPITTIRGA